MGKDNFILPASLECKHGDTQRNAGDGGVSALKMGKHKHGDMGISGYWKTLWDC